MLLKKLQHIHLVSDFSLLKPTAVIVFMAYMSGESDFSYLCIEKADCIDFMKQYNEKRRNSSPSKGVLERSYYESYIKEELASGNIPGGMILPKSAIILTATEEDAKDTFTEIFESSQVF